MGSGDLQLGWWGHGGELCRPRKALIPVSTAYADSDDHGVVVRVLSSLVKVRVLSQDSITGAVAPLPALLHILLSVCLSF